ncbi:cytidine deaminase [Pirellulales bacterium]|nr:cytidine deaminase [Pirellulales bacterium]
MLDEPRQRQLIDAALAAQQNAYAPYSNFSVGAAVLTATGEVFTGCNVENASYGLTICAERVAASSAIAAGHRELSAVAIAIRGSGSPCGACRQFLAEFGPAMDVILIDATQPESSETISLAELLPRQFEFKKES